MNVHEEITLELARLEREAVAKVRKRMSTQQLGLAFENLFAGYFSKLSLADRDAGRRSRPAVAPGDSGLHKSTSTLSRP